ADTLKGVAMFFNRVQDNVNDLFFTLKVWDNNNGKPGNVIWQQESLKPKFSDELYRMQIYQINPSLPLIGTFFIGFEQTTADLLNIGFDTHHDASEHTFYNTSGNWEQSMMAGSMLMRPILSTFYDPFLVEENLPDYTWNIYPNPVSGKLLHIQNSMVSETDLSSSHTTISIYDMPGRKLLSIPYNNTISIDKLPGGMYLLHIMNEDHSINYIHKLLVNN
ncbi:MAG: T9SS type A sorting domain-containing protein, partial [Bacteroidetes bacterium]|nr:T9SS type A sorting domain-containing protein [Bacteroidota bacterium]